MARGTRSQSEHDKKVQRIAKDLERQGYAVKADVPGFPQPGTISGVRPDVLATKGKVRKIVEVETPDSVDSARDQKQQQAFRQSARRSPNTTFRREVTDG